jgi:uncharacterized protein (TIGR02118 family)
MWPYQESPFRTVPIRLGRHRLGQPLAEMAELDHSARLDARRPRMARLVVMYKTPKDVGGFDAYYFNTHVPIAKKIPGLRKYEVSKGPVVTPTGPSGVHLVATLHFDDLAAIQKAFMSPEGLAAVTDVQKFATGGVDMLLFDDAEV